jgi:hypothetical protein
MILLLWFIATYFGIGLIVGLALRRGRDERTNWFDFAADLARCVVVAAVAGKNPAGLVIFPRR